MLSNIPLFEPPRFLHVASSLGVTGSELRRQLAKSAHWSDSVSSLQPTLGVDRGTTVDGDDGDGTDVIGGEVGEYEDEVDAAEEVNEATVSSVAVLPYLLQLRQLCNVG